MSLYVAGLCGWCAGPGEASWKLTADTSLTTTISNVNGEYILSLLILVYLCISLLHFPCNSIQLAPPQPIYKPFTSIYREQGD